MHPTFQLLERHSDQLANIKVHWFDCPEPNHQVKNNDKQFNINWSATGNHLTEQIQIETAQINILFFPKAKDRLDWWLNKIGNCISSDQQIWVVGENSGGIKSLAKRVKDQFECFKIDSARHCALFELRPVPELKPINEWQSYQLGSKKIFSLPGVFSASKLDKGSEFLLQNLPQLKGDVLELGCGAGAISLSIAEQDSVKRVTAFDIDLFAIKSTIRSANENNLSEKIEAIWSAGTAALPKKRYDFIVTNPPFHQGIKTAYAPTEEFFRQAHEWLKPHGKLIWVANDFLTYEPCLENSFKDIKTLDRQRGFKVLEATRA